MRLKMSQIKSWTVSDALWSKIEPLVPERQRPRGRKFQRRPGAGRKPMPSRQVFSAIVYVLRTGCQWKALPRELRQRQRRACALSALAAGRIFPQIWKAGLAEYDEMEGIAWRWQSVDGAMGKAPMALECVGPNSTDRGKKWAQTQSPSGRAWHPAVARRQRGQPA